MSEPPADGNDLCEIRELPQAISSPPSELPRIPGGWTEQQWRIAEHTFRLILPAVPDAFLDDPAVQAAFQRDEYMPYWAFLWPAALKMAATILQADWPQNAEVLEIGAGLGIVSLAGLARGLRVTISDYEPKSVELALFNARRNGFTQVQGLVLDWRLPPQRQFPVIWGCDLLYEDRHHEQLLELTQKLLTRDGVAWFADGGRIPAGRFCQQVSRFGLECRLFDEKLHPLVVPRIGQYQLIELRHRT